MRLVTIIVALVMALAVVPSAHALAEDSGEPRTAEDDSLAEAWAEDVKEQGGWLSRTLHRYFGKAPETGAELGGRAVNTIASYADHEGKRIAVVIVQPVLNFDEVPEEGEESSTAWIKSLGSRFKSHTKEHVIRQYLLFDYGDSIDPYRMADTERMIRNLDFVDDARILVMPLGGDKNEVAVIVEYRDRWPFGIRGAIIDQNRSYLGVYTTNLFGQGILFDNTIKVNRIGDPTVGYRGVLGRDNLRGSFIDAKLTYEDSWVEHSFGGRLRRGIRHGGIAWVGGIYWEETEFRDTEIPRTQQDTDYWIGHVFQLSRAEDLENPARRTLTPAYNFVRLTYLDRPEEVSADTLMGYHNRNHHIVGLTYQKRTDVKTSYLFRMGELEDMPHGMSIQLSGGYEEAEFDERTTAALTMVGMSMPPRGNLFAASFALGGYWRAGDFEDGVLDARVLYVTPMLPTGRYNWRFYFLPAYTRGFERTHPEGLYLGDRAGIRDLADGPVRGDQRFVMKFETRVFTPWRLLGFNIMSLLYADAGVIGSEQDAVLTQKVYSALGLGFRFYNPSLVLPIFELRMGFLQNVENSGFAMAFDLGNAHFPDFIFPGVKPALAPYE